jgi:hypothetical protein
VWLALRWSGMGKLIGLGLILVTVLLLGLGGLYWQGGG